MSKQELYEKLAQNDINLCINTIDENSLIPYQSLELGTPCLVGNSFKYFEGSSLQEYLVVRNTDDILELFIFTFGIDFSLLINLELTVMLKSDILYMIL